MNMHSRTTTHQITEAALQQLWGLLGAETQTQAVQKIKALTCEVEIEAYVSPVPPGYDTVMGYLAKNQPEALQFDMWDAEGTQRDGFWCKHQCTKRGLPVCKVPAPAVFDGEGFELVNAYPVEILSERLGGPV